MKVRDILKYMGYYIEMKDKVLWEGQQMVGAITVPKLSEYDSIEIYTRWGSFAVNTGRGIVSGIHCDWASGNPTQPITHHILGSISGDRLTITMCNYIVHSAGSGHSGNVENQLYISKIIGIEPSKSAILEKIGGGGVSNLAVFLRGVQYVKTHLNTQGSWAAIQDIDRPNNIEKQQLCRVPQRIENMLGRSLWKIWRRNSTPHNIHVRKTSRNTYLQYLYNYALQFWEGAINKYQQSIYNSIRHKNGQSSNIRKIRLCLYRNQLLKIRGCSPCWD
ncbi:hypothetical protein OBO34_16305 [Clostridiales Family XIII bacterium ASD5510]|uniref:Uncharacterized protein n=1 Tax=Hominibacterium faecale TaxID=2839743 RepID=A0A9J6QKV2_9FIRM|nr:hypothetical protein [Hominibacterium faecale]MCU7378120.1 hypothetical protein [Hominibacterium faecale]MCU7379908.1 hypothetical protein [Hominibacterium faecale]